MQNTIIYYTKEYLEKWRDRELIKSWKKQFPDLVQDHHYQILVNAKNKMSVYTFYEYFTGFEYVKKGYKFIFEPYVENFLLQDYKSQEIKNIKSKFICIVKNIIGDDKFEKLMEVCQNYKTGQPDLFIYKEDGSDFFFAEIKSEKDKLRSHQSELISNIQKLIPVKIINLKILK